MVREAMQAIAERRPGRTKLVYDKTRRTIMAVPADTSVRDTRAPHICPVCAGRGIVIAGFYSGAVTGSTAADMCRSCMGSGIVWTPALVLGRALEARDAQ